MYVASSSTYLRLLRLLCFLTFLALSSACGTVPSSECVCVSEPRAFIFVIDSSSSMAKYGGAEEARAAMRLFAGKLTNDVDLFTIIEFDSSARCYEQDCSWRSDSAYIQRTFYVDSDGGTDLDNALNMAMQHIAAFPATVPVPDHKYVVFISDFKGDYKKCKYSTSPITKLRDIYDWPVFAVGVGKDYEKILEDVGTCDPDSVWTDTVPAPIVDEVFAASYTISCTCGAGRYLPDGAQECVDTPAGTFSPADDNNKYPCPTGTVSEAGAAQCVPCPVNSFAYSSTECRSNPGYYGPHENIGSNPTYTVCPAGTYCPAGATAPIPCPPDTVSAAGAEVCTACGPNASPNPAGTECVCGAGYYLFLGACVETPPGTYSPDADNSKYPCTGDQYQPSAGQATCLDCPPGSYTPTPTECVTCSAGYSCDGDEATPCPPNTYSPAGSSSCSPCPEGGQSNAAAETCFAKPGYYGPTSTTSFLPCPVGHKCPGATAPVPAVKIPCSAGEYQDQTRQTTCLDCPVHTYSDAGAAQCTPCPLNHYANPSHTACIACPAGQVVHPTEDACEGCTGNTYAVNVGDPCTPCPPGSHANDAHTHCVPNAGYYLVSYPATVAICEPGYKCPCSDGSGAIQCPTGTTRLPCQPGEYQPLTGQIICERCRDIDDYSYSDQAAATECKTCPAGVYADPSGTHCDSSCLPGQYYDVDSGDCFPCPAGLWSAGCFALQCEQCPEHTIVAADQSTCVAAPGYYAGPGTTPGAVKPCNTRHYCPGGDPNQPTVVAPQIPCPAGTYQDLMAQTECKPCVGDDTWSPPASLECQECPLGMVALPDHTDCEYCPAGTYESSSGVCDPCPAGYSCDLGLKTPCLGDTFSTGSGGCMPCPSNSEPTPDHTQCSALPGYYGIGTEPSDIEQCGVGHFCAGGLHREPCPLSQYQPSPTESSCLSCGDLPDAEDRYSDVTGAAECKTCPPGFLANVFHTGCTTCPAGTYEDQNTCVPCTGDNEYALPGATSCSLCPTGTEASPDHSTCIVLPGWWVDGNDPTDPGAVHPCTPGHYCLNGVQIPCPAGFYQDEPKARTCKPCAGLEQYSPEPASVACMRCPHNSVATVGNTGCRLCPASTFETSPGVCGMCPENTYSFAGTGCLSCPPHSSPNCGRTGCTADPGYHTTDGEDLLGDDQGQPINSLVECPPGYYCPGDNKKHPCELGHYSPSPGLATCRKCSAIPDAWSPAGPQTECQYCPHGQVPAHGAGACVGCSPGEYEFPAGTCAPCGNNEISGVGAACCTLCGLGTVSNFEHTLCIIPRGFYGVITNGVPVEVHKCPKGYYCSGGKEAPEPCTGNTYTDFEGAHTCFHCDCGSIASADHTECIECLPGTFECEENPGQCNDCLPGHYCTDGVMTPCPAGTYQDLFGQTECKPCDGGWTGQAGSTECPECPRFFESLGGGQCRRCTSTQYYDDSDMLCLECSALQGQTYCKSTTAYSNEPANILATCPAYDHIPTQQRTSCVPCPQGAFCDGTTNLLTVLASTTTIVVGGGIGALVILGVVATFLLRKKTSILSPGVRTV